MSDIFDYDSIIKDEGSIKYILYKLVEHDAINEVKYEGFPDRFMSHDIELLNYRYTMCCIDEFMGNPTVCKMSLLPNFKNIYGMPTKCMVTYPDMRTENRDMYTKYTPEGVVPFYDTMIPGDGRAERVWPWILAYYDIQLTINTQTATHRTPLIMTGTDRKEIQNQARLITDIGAGVKVLAMPQKVVKELQVLDLKAPWNGTELIQMQAEYIRRIYASLGLDAPSWQKKERLIGDEQEANTETLSLVLQDMLEARSLSCELANEKYGWNVTVDLTKPKRLDKYEKNSGEDGGPDTNDW